MNISLAPAPSVWGRKKLKEFYSKVAKMSVDIVYLGEIVCLKRDVLSVVDIKEIIKLLKENGKKVYISSPILMTTLEEYKNTEKILFLGDGVEANSLGILNKFTKMKTREKKLAIGASINVYNRDSARFFEEINAERLILPLELSFDDVADIIVNTSSKIEVYVWGNVPCSISWRCYAARAKGLTRENCAKCCFKTKEGILLRNPDKEDVFIINGTQVLSAKTLNLVQELDELKKAGIDTIRITPHYEYSREIINIFKEVLDNEKRREEAFQDLGQYAQSGFNNGWFYSQAGIKQIKN